MADDKLVTVRRCGPIWQAEMIRDRLEAAGLRAFVQGSESNRMLSHVGTALGGVRVQVPASELETAREVLLADERQRATAGPWQCPRCDEPNEASFDVCWSCSMPRGSTPAMEPGFEAATEADAEGPAETPWTGSARNPPAETLNAYQSAAWDEFTASDRTGGLGVVRIFTALILIAVVAYATVALAEALFVTPPAR